MTLTEMRYAIAPPCLSALMSIRSTKKIPRRGTQIACIIIAKCQYIRSHCAVDGKVDGDGFGLCPSRIFMLMMDEGYMYDGCAIK